MLLEKRREAKQSNLGRIAQGSLDKKRRSLETELYLNNYIINKMRHVSLAKKYFNYYANNY